MDSACQGGILLADQFCALGGGGGVIPLKQRSNMNSLPTSARRIFVLGVLFVSPKCIAVGICLHSSSSTQPLCLD